MCCRKESDTHWVTNTLTLFTSSFLLLLRKFQLDSLVFVILSVSQLSEIISYMF